MYYSFYEKEPYMDVRYRVNWNEKHVVLKLVSDVVANDHVASVAYGSVSRGESKAELPIGEWIKAGNLTLAFDHIFAYTMIDKKLGLTVLRSPIYADLRISDIDLERDYDIMQQGITEGEIRIGLGEISNGSAFSAELNNPPIVLCESNHNGKLKPVGSFLSIDSELGFCSNLIIYKPLFVSVHPHKLSIESQNHRKRCRKEGRRVVRHIEIGEWPWRRRYSPLAQK
jgi:hypothetical protein